MNPAGSNSWSGVHYCRLGSALKSDESSPRLHVHRIDRDISFLPFIVLMFPCFPRAWLPVVYVLLRVLAGVGAALIEVSGLDPSSPALLRD